MLTWSLYASNYGPWKQTCLESSHGRLPDWPSSVGHARRLCRIPHTLSQLHFWIQLNVTVQDKSLDGTDSEWRSHPFKYG